MCLTLMVRTCILTSDASSTLSCIPETCQRCRDDPTIMAWSVANEPRCQGDWSGSILQVRRWLRPASLLVLSCTFAWELLTREAWQAYSRHA